MPPTTPNSSTDLSELRTQLKAAAAEVARCEKQEREVLGTPGWQSAKSQLYAAVARHLELEVAVAEAIRAAGEPAPTPAADGPPLDTLFRRASEWTSEDVAADEARHQRLMATQPEYAKL
jgi:hypothetical protein